LGKGNIIDLTMGLARQGTSNSGRSSEEGAHPPNRQQSLTNGCLAISRTPKKARMPNGVFRKKNRDFAGIVKGGGRVVAIFFKAVYVGFKRAAYKGKNSRANFSQPGPRPGGGRFLLAGPPVGTSVVQESMARNQEKGSPRDFQSFQLSNTGGPPPAAFGNR